MSADIVALPRWLFERLCKDAAGSAADLGSIVGSGDSVATVAYLKARGLWPEGAWMDEATAGYCDALIGSFRRLAAADPAEVVEALGKMVEEAVRERQVRERSR